MIKRVGAEEDLRFHTPNLTDREDLLFAVDFYREANRLSCEALAAQRFTRDEPWDGPHEVMALYGVTFPGV